MNLILFDTEAARSALAPFTFTRPVANIRIGIFTIAEKWIERLEVDVTYKTIEYLSAKFPMSLQNENYLVDGSICPDKALVSRVKDLNLGEGLFKSGRLLACKVSDEVATSAIENHSFPIVKEYDGEVRTIDSVHDIFRMNAAEIVADLEVIRSKRTSVGISDPHTVVYGEENVFVEEGTSIKAAIINAIDGPVYIGKNAVVHEGAIIHGAFALCEGSHVSMGAKMRGDSTIGPYSKVGGEVSNSVIFGYSSKGHDGFLGNSVLGEWCNLGAGTNNSNLKNDYSEVKIWNYAAEGFRKTGLQFCGLIMGDHSKCAINTMFNTGTVVGVCANVFGAGFPRNFVPSFSWGGAQQLSTYQIKKTHEVVAKVMKRRNLEYDDIERDILQQIFDDTAKFRSWDR